MTQTLPHELAPQRRIYTCWPAAPEEWGGDLSPARRDFARFLKPLLQPGVQPWVQAGAQAGAGQDFGVTVLVRDGESEASARQALGSRFTLVKAPYGDVWVRDTGPVFTIEDGRLIAHRFKFNGWGGKYEMPGDETVAATIARLAGAELRDVDLVTEGGALEFDGEGTLLTTRQALANPNRNPGLSEAQIEARLKDSLGVKKVLWLDEGLIGDHTDGHVDNIARFVAPGHVVCQQPFGPDDPNARLLADIARQLRRMRDAKGRRLRVSLIPSPGRVLDGEGEIAAASHMNWVIGPRHVVMPGYGGPAEAAALRALRPLLPGRTLVASPARGVLIGGGAFHCTTCNQPAV